MCNHVQASRGRANNSGPQLGVLGVRKFAMLAQVDMMLEGLSIFKMLVGPHDVYLIAAAGGRFRGKIGRKLFKATKLCQSIIQPDIVTNKVCKNNQFPAVLVQILHWTQITSCWRSCAGCTWYIDHFLSVQQACHSRWTRVNFLCLQVEFVLLGIWRGYVGLRGRLEAQGTNQDTAKVGNLTDTMPWAFESTI